MFFVYFLPAWDEVSSYSEQHLFFKFRKYIIIEGILKALYICVIKTVALRAL